MSTRRLASLLAALLLLAAPRAAQDPVADFDQADLERLVAEVMTVAPEYPHYTYPIQCTYLTGVTPEGLDQDKVLNAYSYADESGQAYVALYRGLVAACGGDEGEIRAVLAHEVAHLSNGHSVERLGPRRDLVQIYGRQQEREADEHGARYLEALGHPRQDMVDMLHVLQRQAVSDNSWLTHVSSDHASPMMRALAITGDDELVRAASLFELGTAYMECRRYREAISFFEEAAQASSLCLEAGLNAASAALQDYYDRLPAAVQEEWLRPEFGAHLTDLVLLRGRAIEITDQDAARYLEARRRIEGSLDLFHDPLQAFLRGTAKVLHPFGDEAELRAGVAELRALLALTPSGGWAPQDYALRVTNNLAVGLARLGEEEEAARLLCDAMIAAPVYLVSVGENLARLPLDSMAESEALQVLELFHFFLQWSPVDAPGTRAAGRAAEQLLTRFGKKFETPPVPSPLALCSAVTMTIQGHELGLFEPMANVSRTLGELGEARVAEERFPGLLIARWAGGEVLALVEDGRLVKLTSYLADSSVELRPTRDSGQRAGFRVKVGMSFDEFERLLAPSGGSAGQRMRQVQLVSRISHDAPVALKPESSTDEEFAAMLSTAIDETWNYYPFLNLGLLVEEGVIAGLAVTPARFYDGELDDLAPGQPR